MDTTYLKNMHALWHSAAVTIPDDDAYFALVMLMDPSGEVSEAIRAMDEAEEQARYMAMSAAERARYDAESQHLHEIGLNAMRKVLAEARAKPLT